LAFLVVLGAAVTYLLRPSDTLQTVYKVPRGASINRVMRELEGMGVIHSEKLSLLIARFSKIKTIRSGVYIIRPHATIGQVFKDLSVPVEVSVRCPEGYWIKRTSSFIKEQYGNHIDDLGYTEAAAPNVPFKADGDNLVSAASHEGRLYPGTYTVPFGFRGGDVVEAQLREFDSKVAPLLVGHDEARVLTIASLVELEASDPEERRIIAGIIENRLARNMRLEIDATVLYAIQRWKVLPPGFVHTVKSPYNTYEHAGLPPGPICSPTVVSVKDALNPVKSDYLFYVSKGHDRHLFARTYAEHVANIKLARGLQK
jgi:UPF0755 protein